MPEGKYGLNIPNTAIVDEEETKKVENDVVKPAMNAVKANSPKGNVHEQDEITYTISVDNLKGTEAIDIVVEDAAPAGTTLVPDSIVTPKGATYEQVGEKGVKWRMTLSAGAEAKEFKFTVTVNKLENGKYTLDIPNTATVNEEPTNEVKNTVIKAHLTNPSKTSNPASGKTVKYGETITYTISVENDGSESKSVTITDEIPANTRFDIKSQATGFNGELKNNTTTGKQYLEWKVTVPAKDKKTNKNGKISVSFTVTVIGDAPKFIENTAYVDETPVGPTHHDIVKVVTTNSSNNPGKNIVLVLDLTSSMLKVKRGTLTEYSDFYYGAQEPIKDNNSYVYPVNASDSKERTNSSLAAAKKAINKFAKQVLTPNSGNKITLVTFNYSGETKQKALEAISSAMSKEPSWYSNTRLADIEANTEIHEFLGTKVLIATDDYDKFSKKVDSIRLRADYLCTNMVSALRKTNSVVSGLVPEGKHIDVIFFGDGKPSYNTEMGAKVGFYSETETNSLLATLGTQIRANASLYTLEYFEVEDGVKREKAQLAFEKMTGVATSKLNSATNKTRFAATSQEAVNTKLTEIATTMNAPLNGSGTTNEKGIATIEIPQGLTLRIGTYAKVKLYVKAPGETKSTLHSEYATTDKINESGIITYVEGNSTKKSKFTVDTTKFAAGSEINLNYYYKTK